MSLIQIYDKPMCCSTGICGPQVDPVLPRFAADLDWLKTQGHRVDRFNLAQQPQEFVGNSVVQQALAQQGAECLPLILVDGQIVNRQSYPTREQLIELANGRTIDSPQLVSSSQLIDLLPVMTESGSCCSGTSCC